jgi:hypothetical protein
VILTGFDIGFGVRPADGFAGSGDAVVAREHAGRIMLAIIDVLGHGPEAHAVAVSAEAALDATSLSDPESAIMMLHDRLTNSLGAAAGIATVDSFTGHGRFVGVGNTVARVFGDTERRFVSVDGVLGQRRPGLRPVEFSLEPGEVLVMHSDGVSSRFLLADYPMLRADEPNVIAREVIRRFGRNHDDAACLAARRMT